MVSYNFSQIQTALNNLPKPKLTATGIPIPHWCGHYKDSSDQVIPDGSKCCWVHWVGLPTRWGIRHPYYHWEEDLLKDLQSGIRYFYMLKPPKIGATQFWLSYAEHQAMTEPSWLNGQVAIVVGTNFGEAEQMITRAKEILENKDKTGKGLGNYKVDIHEDYNTKKEFSINTVQFRAHPANNIDAIRSKPNMKMIIIDEGSFFKIRVEDQQKIRDAFEHYIGGSNTLIVLLSTAGHVPAGFMYDIQKEEPSIYKKYILDYHVGLEVHPESHTSLYNEEQINKIKDSPSFARNYMHQWGHGSGDIFDITALDACSKQPYDLRPRQDCEKILAIDPGYGSSKSGLVGMERRDGKLYVIQAQQYARPSQTELINIIKQSIQTYGYRQIRIDSAIVGLIEDMRREISTYPVSFRERGQIMTDTASMQIKAQQVMIDPSFDELLKQLRAARKNEKGTVDKEIATFDLYDGFIMAVDYFSSDLIGVTEHDDEAPRSSSSIRIVDG